MPKVSKVLSEALAPVEPVFNKFEAKFGHAMLSIPATKAFEIGSDFPRKQSTTIPFIGHGRSDGRLWDKY